MSDTIIKITEIANNATHNFSNFCNLSLNIITPFYIWDSTYIIPQNNSPDNLRGYFLFLFYDGEFVFAFFDDGDLV